MRVAKQADVLMLLGRAFHKVAAATTNELYAVCDKPKDAQFVCRGPHNASQLVDIHGKEKLCTSIQNVGSKHPQIICTGACTQEVEPQVLLGGQGSLGGSVACLLGDTCSKNGCLLLVHSKQPHVPG